MNPYEKKEAAWRKTPGSASKKMTRVKLDPSCRKYWFKRKATPSPPSSLHTVADKMKMVRRVAHQLEYSDGHQAWKKACPENIFKKALKHSLPKRRWNNSWRKEKRVSVIQHTNGEKMEVEPTSEEEKKIKQAQVTAEAASEFETGKTPTSEGKITVVTITRRLFPTHESLDGQKSLKSILKAAVEEEMKKKEIHTPQERTTGPRTPRTRSPNHPWTPPRRSPGCGFRQWIDHSPVNPDIPTPKNKTPEKKEPPNFTLYSPISSTSWKSIKSSTPSTMPLPRTPPKDKTPIRQTAPSPSYSPKTPSEHGENDDGRRHIKDMADREIKLKRSRDANDVYLRLEDAVKSLKYVTDDYPTYKGVDKDKVRDLIKKIEDLQRPIGDEILEMVCSE